MSESQNKNKWSNEHKQLLHDYLKHMVTISTGMILIMVTFLHQISKNPEWKFCVAIALVSFMATVFGCILVQTADIFDINHSEDWSANVAIFGISIAWMGFVTGIIALVVFGLKNIL
ncbi:MAG: DUF751 domain-containing protein [Piscirickettsiaceae bacterium]|nr:DUF751 domain-containing protein [Piscirickettsiaceae bacterium]